MTVASYSFTQNIDPSLMGEQGQPLYSFREQSRSHPTAYSQSPDLLEVVSNASEKMLEGNGHFLRMKMVTDQRAIEIANLQAVVTAQAKEISDSKVEIKTLKDALALFADDYHEGSRPTGRVLATIRSGNLPDKPAARKRTDFPEVVRWKREELKLPTNTQKGGTDGNATSAPTKAKPGRPTRKGAEEDNKPQTHAYLENEDGTFVDAEQIAAMSRKARMLWRTLDEDGMAPQKFGQMSSKAWEYFSRMMLADEAHDYLLLCDDGEWKLKEWSTRSYPSWHRNRTAQMEKDLAESRGKDGSAPPSDNTGAGDSSTSDTGSNREDALATNADNNNAPHVQNAGDDNDNEGQDPAHDDDDERRPEHHAAHGMPHKSTTSAVEARAPMTSVITDPFAHTPSTSTTTGPESNTPNEQNPPTHSDASAVSSHTPGAEDTPAATTSGAEQALPAASEAHATNNADPGRNDQGIQPPHSEASPDIENLRLDQAKAREGKKRKAEGTQSAVLTKKQKRANGVAKPTNSNSIKNICMRHWTETQPEGQGLLNDFETYFKSLSDTDKEPFKAESRVAQIAARKNKTAAKKTTDTTN